MLGSTQMNKIRIINDEGMIALVLLSESELYPEGTVYPVVYVGYGEDTMIMESMSWIESKVLVEEIEYDGETDYKSLYENIIDKRGISLSEEEKKMYLYIDGNITYINHWDEVIDAWEHNGISSDDFNIGFHDYSLEFSFDGSFLYPVDRDDRKNSGDKIYFKSLMELISIMESHGSMYRDFMMELEGHCIISNYNNMDDFYVYEIRESDLFADKKILTLYQEYFKKEHDWNAICNQLDVSSMSEQVEIVFVSARSIACEIEENGS